MEPLRVKDLPPEERPRPFGVIGAGRMEALAALLAAGGPLAGPEAAGPASPPPRPPAPAGGPASRPAGASLALSEEEVRRKCPPLCPRHGLACREHGVLYMPNPNGGAAVARRRRQLQALAVRQALRALGPGPAFPCASCLDEHPRSAARLGASGDLMCGDCAGYSWQVASAAPRQGDGFLRAEEVPGFRYLDDDAPAEPDPAPEPENPPDVAQPLPPGEPAADFARPLGGESDRSGAIDGGGDFGTRRTP